ncbi:hypothetical protein Tco_1447969 [Tanacetum coccineum]
MSIILREKLSRNLQSSTVIRPRSNDETISTFVKADKPSIRHIDASQYGVSNLQNINLFSDSKKMTLPSPNHLNDDYWEKLKETDREKDLEAHYTNAKPLGKALPRKEKDPGSFSLPCFINNMCFNKALADLGASVIDTPIKEMVKTRHDDDKITNGIKDYPSFSNLDRKIHVNDAYNLRQFGIKRKSVVGALMNAPIFVGTFSVVTDFAVIEDMDHYHDEEMGDVIVGKPFCEASCVETKRFDGMITIHGDDESVTYQIVWSHPRFKHHTNEQCNKIPPLLKDPILSEIREWKKGSHAGTLACIRWNGKGS